MTLKPLPRLFNLTRYDLLLHYGGEEHALHSVSRKLKTTRGQFVICSCAEAVQVPDAPEVTAALKNVQPVVTT